MKKILVLLSIFVLLLCGTLVACSEPNGSGGGTEDGNPVVVFTLSTGDTIRMELYPDVAPKSVENFLVYVREGYYVGVVFHRIINGFMVQTGGYTYQDGFLQEKAGLHDPIVGEFASNGYTNDLLHTAGVVSMARSTLPNSATAQFFIVAETSPHLDGDYAAFGRVDEASLAVVQRLQQVATGRGYLALGGYLYPMSDVPIEPITIVSCELQ